MERMCHFHGWLIWDSYYLMNKIMNCHLDKEMVVHAFCHIILFIQTQIWDMNFWSQEFLFQKLRICTRDDLLYYHRIVFWSYGQSKCLTWNLPFGTNSLNASIFWEFFFSLVLFGIVYSFPKFCDCLWCRWTLPSSSMELLHWLHCGFHQQSFLSLIPSLWYAFPFMLQKHMPNSIVEQTS